VAKRKEARISLCMIVRDEEPILARCLESARSFVDEMVIVDTGSSDRTREIATSFGATVIDHPWNDDFSEARNVALEHATGDWVLSLDADEILTPLAGRELRKVARRGNYVGAYIPLRDEGDGGKVTVSLMFRAWMRHPTIRWRYRLHEQVLAGALALVQSKGLRLAQLSGEILHDGYRQEVMESKGKDARNARLYLAQLEDTPDDPYVLYKYADFLRRIPERQEDARTPMERCYGILQQIPETDRRNYSFSGEACALLALRLMFDGEADAALSVTRFGIDHCRESAHLWYAHGEALVRAALWKEAETAFLRCASFHGRPMLIPPQAHITGLAARKGLIRALHAQGQLKEAASAAHALVDSWPDDTEAIDLWVDTGAAAGDWRTLTQQLIDRVQARPECGKLWMKGGEFFFRLRLFDKAVTWLNRAAGLLADPGPAHGLAGESFLAAGEFQAAVGCFSQAPNNLTCRAGILLLSLAFDVELAEPVQPDDQTLRTELRRMVNNLRDLGQNKIHDQVYEAVLRLEETDPATGRFLEAALA
jgi:glycosyltransferase involved in cell wall biosynthesis